MGERRSGRFSVAVTETEECSMPDVASRLPCLIAILALAAVNAVASAAGPRMYVASSGADGNPCTTSAPCRTLQYAVSSVDPGGDVIIVDSAGYGPVAITKSVSIIAPRGLYAGISVTSGIGIDVGAPGIKVLLEGLTINGVGTGTTGIRFAAGSQLEIVRCAVSGMTAAGLVATAAGAKVHVADTTFDSDVVGASFAGVTATLERVTAGHNSYIAPTLKVGIQIGAQARVALRNSSIAHNYDGIVVDNAAGSTTTLTVDSTLIVDNHQGVHVTASGAGSMALVDIIRSTISGYIWYGVVVDATAPAVAAVTLSANDISRHIYAGVSAKNSGALVLATGNTLSRNGTTGLEQSAGAVLQSLGNNTIEPAAGATVGTISTVSGY